MDFSINNAFARKFVINHTTQLHYGDKVDIHVICPELKFKKQIYINRRKNPWKSLSLIDIMCNNDHSEAHNQEYTVENEKMPQQN